MPNDEQLPASSASSCPFMPPVLMPSKHALHRTSVDLRPIPCLGARDPFQGGGCAAWELCQGAPKSLDRVANILSAYLEKHG
jgi:hypothetical protein